MAGDTGAAGGTATKPARGPVSRGQLVRRRLFAKPRFWVGAGFVTIDILARRAHASFWKSEAGCMTCRTQLKGTDGEPCPIVLAKPQSYMNTSGRTAFGNA